MLLMTSNSMDVLQTLIMSETLNQNWKGDKKKAEVI